MNLNFTKDTIEEARVRSSMAAMVDIDTFLSALDDIEALQYRLKRTEENVLALRGELENARKAWREHMGKTQKAREAIQGILENPQGCPMCDAGVLRNPKKVHWDDCPYEIARSTLEDANV